MTAYWSWSGGGFGLPETVALAAVAAIGYLFGRRGALPKPKGEPTGELLRAAEIARQLETVAATLRGHLASHRTEIERFKAEVRRTGAESSGESCQALRGEAERVLAPTLRLVSQLATAYDQIRQQSIALSSFSGGRVDPLTGLCNGRALTELLEVELTGHTATRAELSVAMFSLSSSSNECESKEAQQRRLTEAADAVRRQLRGRDLVARYGVDELVVVMPHTRLYGASVLGHRVRAALSAEAGVTASCGLAQSLPGDTPEAVLARADSALYSAKAAGDGRQYLHTGATIRADADPAGGAPVEGVAEEPVAVRVPIEPAPTLRLAEVVD
ncbi:MAG: GGDEF domain-containing protein [Planctomycetota bacterium]